MTNAGTSMNVIIHVFFSTLLLLFLFNNKEIHGQPVLDLDYMTSTEIAADLSFRVYEDFRDAHRDTKYDSIQVYRDGPEQALLATKNGRCYVAFQGFDIWNIRDIFQENVLRGLRCMSGWPGRDDTTTTTASTTTTTADCCKTRAPIWKGYTTDYRTQLENDIFNCQLNCKDPEDCLFLTGYSSGGGVAQVAAVMLQDTNANVIAFGTEPTLSPECGALINPNRWVRWANTRINARGDGLQYDRYPWEETRNGLVNFGYTYVVSEGGVANFGLNQWEEKEQVLTPFDPMRLYRSHRMYTHDSRESPGYGDQIHTLLAQGKFPIPTTGYAIGSFCTVDKECASGECGDMGTCE